MHAGLVPSLFLFFLTELTAAQKDQCAEYFSRQEHFPKVFWKTGVTATGKQQCRGFLLDLLRTVNVID